jgi:hypothetical protein
VRIDPKQLPFQHARSIDRAYRIAAATAVELGNFHVTEHPVLRPSTTIDLLVALSIPVNISLVP